MKNHHFLKALVCSMALCTVFSLCGCGETDSNEPSAQTQTSSETSSSDNPAGDAGSTAADSAPDVSKGEYKDPEYSLGTIFKSGKCGENLTWELDHNGLFVISGSGDMDDYSEDSPPWHDSKFMIKTVIVKNGATSIGGGAFDECDSLTSVTIPDSITRIEARTFDDCKSLTDITIPNSVTSIGYSAFGDCTNLTSITIPDSVTSIGDFAFDNCENLAGITFSDNLTNIGEEAFGDTAWYYAQPDGLIYLGKAIYNYKGDMPSDTSIVLKDDIIEISAGAFTYCENLKSIKIPDSVTSIGHNAFDGCYDLTSITIPDSVTAIGNEVFRDCKSLTSIKIPSGVTSIGDKVFDGCKSLTSINVDEANGNYCSVNDMLFDKNKTELICCPISKTGTFTIPDSVTSIKDRAFADCKNLKSITIPNGVTSIGEKAFDYCNSLESITISDSVTSIGNEAFGRCENLKNINIPASVTSMGDNVFGNCESLTSINVDEANGNYCSVDGILFNKEKTELICCPQSKTGAFTIPDSVTAIETMAFYYCTNLTSVTIPNSVTSIKEEAFSGWSSSQTINIKGKSSAPSEWDENWSENCEAKIVWNA